MRSMSRIMVAVLACIFGLAAAKTVQLNGRSYPVGKVITRDFAIVGGGAARTYSADRLQDLNQTVVVIEKETRLGGHTYTYIDPQTGTGIEAGVQVFYNNSFVTNWFGRFNISLGPAVFSQPGVVTENVVLQSASELEDSLLPFGDFVDKYSLRTMIQTVASMNRGLGNILNQSTLYVMAAFNLELLENLEVGFVTTANHDNSALYEKALSLPRSTNILLSSEVMATDRTGSYAKILVHGPEGFTLIQAKKIVSTIPPKIENLKGWDLDSKESSLFKQFSNIAYYTALLTDTGIPSNISIASLSNNISTYYLPDLPSAYSIQQTTVPGLIAVTYGSQTALSEGQVKHSILEEIKQFLSASGLPKSSPAFVNFQNHTPFRMTVPAEAIANGFYEQLYGLQGHLKTY